MEKRILYLTHDGLTDPLGQSQILPYLVGLSRNGFRITIVSFEKPDRFESGERNIRKICDDVGISWLPLRYHRTPPVIATLCDVLKLRRVASRLVRQHRYSIVHCRSYVTSLAGLHLKFRYGLRFIFDMRGFWADERVEGGLWNLENPIFRTIYRYFKKRELEFIKNADHTVVLTEAAGKFITESFKVTNVSVIPCCVDMEIFNRNRVDQSRVRSLRAELGIAVDDPVLLYLGSLGTWYLTDEMFDYFRSLRKQNPSTRFVVLTPDTALVPKEENIITRSVPRREVPNYIALANASVCFIKPVFSKTGSSATKMAEVLAMGVPVLVNPGWGDVDHLKDEVPGITLVDPENPNATFPPAFSGSGDRFREYFSLESGVRKYSAIYEELIQDL
jgi:glycosyltransferase involved in cell wall biosynthesis